MTFSTNITWKARWKNINLRWRTDVLIIYRCERCISSKNVCTHVFMSNVASEFDFHSPSFLNRTIVLQQVCSPADKGLLPQRSLLWEVKDPSLSSRHRLCKQQLADVEEEIMGMSNSVLNPLICSYDFSLFVLGFRHMYWSSVICISHWVFFANLCIKNPKNVFNMSISGCGRTRNL